MILIMIGVHQLLPSQAGIRELLHLDIDDGVSQWLAVATGGADTTCGNTCGGDGGRRLTSVVVSTFVDEPT